MLNDQCYEYSPGFGPNKLAALLEFFLADNLDGVRSVYSSCSISLIGILDLFYTFAAVLYQKTWENLL